MTLTIALAFIFIFWFCGVIIALCVYKRRRRSQRARRNRTSTILPMSRSEPSHSPSPAPASTGKAARREYHDNLLRTQMVVRSGKTKDRKSKSALPSDVLNLDDRDSPPTCAICLGEYEVGDVVGHSHNRLCKHAFHKSCILDWLDDHDDCPCCRNSYVELSDDEQEEERPSDDARNTRRTPFFSLETWESWDLTSLFTSSESSDIDSMNDASGRGGAHANRIQGTAPSSASIRSQVEKAQREINEGILELATLVGQTLVAPPTLPSSSLSLEDFITHSLQLYDTQSEQAQRIGAAHRSASDMDVALRDAMIESGLDAIRSKLTLSQDLLLNMISGDSEPAE